jgi:hypothetical protein
MGRFLLCTNHFSKMLWMRDEFQEMELSSMRSETLRLEGGEKEVFGEGLKPFKV